MKCFGGRFVSRLGTPGWAKVSNMHIKNWRQTEEHNKRISASNIQDGLLKANAGQVFGAGTVQINFNRVSRI
jgi:hypothetical protein